MNLDEMLKALEDEATESGERILADARAQANEILSAAKNEGEKSAARSLETVTQRLKLEEAKILSAANFDVKKEVLNAKEKVLEQLFTKLGEVAKQELATEEKVLKILASEALSKFKDQKVKVLVGKGKKEITEKVLSEARASVEDSLDSIGGLKVVSEDGRISIDNTVEGRLQKIRQIYEPEIIKNLFGGEN